MRLYLVRHAIAVPREHPDYQDDDIKRPLTDEGHEQAERVARGLDRLKIEPSLIVSSPLVRAEQTAEHLGSVLRARIQELDALEPDTNPKETSQALKTFADHEELILIGHEPHLSAWMKELVAGSGELNVLVKKGGVACIDIERVPPPAGSGLLRWLMTPKQLALIAKS